MIKHDKNKIVCFIYEHNGINCQLQECDIICSEKDIESWCINELNVPTQECIPRKFNYNDAVARLKSWLLYSFLQPSHWPKNDFGTLFNHFASRKQRRTEYNNSMTGNFFKAFSKAIFGEEILLTRYPLPENFALLLSRSHLTHEFEWATSYPPPGRYFNGDF